MRHQDVKAVWWAFGLAVGLLGQASAADSWKLTETFDEARLCSPVPCLTNEFLSNVLSQDTLFLAISGYRMDNKPAGVEIYKRDPILGRWIEKQKILPPVELENSNFGFRVAVDGDIAMITTDGWRGLVSSVRVPEPITVIVYNYKPLTGLWEQTQVFAIPHSGRNFHRPNIALSGKNAVVQVEGSDNFILYLNALTGQWEQKQRIRTPETDVGYALALSGKALFIGDAFYSQKKTGVWVYKQHLAPPAYHVSSAALDGDTAVVKLSKPATPPDYLDGKNDVYVFKFNPARNLWEKTQRLNESTDSLLHIVAVNGDTAVVSYWTNDFGTDYTPHYLKLFRYNSSTRIWKKTQELNNDSRDLGTYLIRVSIDSGHLFFSLEDDAGGIDRAHLYESHEPIRANWLTRLQKLPQSYRFSSNTWGCPSDAAGKVKFQAEITNTSQYPLSRISLEIDHITKGNRVLAGARLLTNDDRFEIGKKGKYEDGVLGINESIQVPVTVCLKNKIPFKIDLSVWASR